MAMPNDTLTPREELRLLLEDADELVTGLALRLLDQPELIPQLETGLGHLADLLLQREVAAVQLQLLGAQLEVKRGASIH